MTAAMNPRKLQRLLLIGFAGFAVLAAGNFLYRRWSRAPSAVSAPPAATGQNLASAILNFERIYPATGLRIAAQSARIFTDKSWELQQVEVNARQKDGHQLTVRAERADVKQVEALEQGEVGRIELSGNVEVEREDGFVLRSDALTYVARERLVRTRAPIQWRRKNAEGGGTGLRYDIDAETVEIPRDATITIRNASPRPGMRGDALASARKLSLDLGGGILVLDGDAALAQAGTRLAAERLELTLSPDRERIVALRGRGGIDATFSSDSGGRRLTADELALTMAEDGTHFEDATASGQARLVFDASATRGRRELAARSLHGQFHPGLDALRRVEAEGGVRLLLEPRAVGEPGREVTARRGWAELPADGPAERVHLEEDVVFLGDGRRASGQVGDLQAGILTLTGAPELVEGGRRIRAQSLAYEEKTGVLVGTNEVRVELERPPAGGPERGPLQISARTMRYDPRAGRAEFTGAVHSQQGEDAIDADRLILLTKTSDFNAEGNVRTAFAPRAPAEPPKPGKDAGGMFGGSAPALFKSDQLDYADGEGVFRYRGHVVGIQGRDSMRAESVDLYRVGERLEAAGNVFAVFYGQAIGPAQGAEDGRTKLAAKAQELRYLGGEDRVSLKGSAELSQKGRDLRGQTIEVQLNEAGEAISVHAEGNVVIEGPDQKGACELLDYDVPSDTFILRGKTQEATFYQLGKTSMRGRELTLRGGAGRTISLVPAEGARVLTLHYPSEEELPPKDQDDDRP